MVDALLLAVPALWLLWIAAHLVMMASMRPRWPTYNGFRIYVPPRFVMRLTHDELEAVIAHEIGHQRLGHVWENFARVCVFYRTGEKRLMQQELEADDFATLLLRGDVLASALRKISTHPFDLWRAARLDLRQMQKDRLKKGPQDAGDLAPGTGEEHNIREG
jgi:hypothetical protein